jgi:hypothetical protein
MSYIAIVLCFAFVCTSQLWCADPIRNTGSPMTIPFSCTDEDIAQAGLSCTEESPCPVYVELTATAGLGSKIFISGNIHSESSTLYSLLLQSDDGGETWTEPYTRIRGASFDFIQFPDFEHGWVSGEMLQPIARDPFFLITSDGAKTWRRRPVFEDGTAGSIQSFWLNSPTTGAMVIDKGSGSSRYQLFESPTGGDTWSIRESSPTPIRIKSLPPAGTGAWRLRADAKTKAFRLEKATGESWTPVASFLIATGPCKPPEPAPEKSDAAPQD